jgi:diguanylate cyclase (GGDEF)-like protein
VTRQWFSALSRNIPRGSRLPENARIFRHRKIVWFTLAAAVVVGILALFHGQPPAYALVASAIPAVIAAAAWKSPLPYRARSSIAAVGLMVIAVATVQVTGTVEAHFLFFIMVPVVALYEDWAPIAAAVGTVLIHHIVLGILAPQQLAGYAEPWHDLAGQAVLHIGMFLATCITSVMHWTIHERARAEERILLDRLAALAQHDPLTGLANRALLHERLLDAASADEPILVLAVDIDGFKPVNDSHGHAAGDALLIEMARRLESCIRNGDTAARTGGDEFTLVLPRSGRERGSAIAQRILDVLAEPVDLAGTQLSVTASIGITIGSSHTDPRTLLEQADAAMYAAKLSGRAAYAFYSEAPAAEADGPLVVDPDDARAWAAYTRNLRQEIAQAKHLGTLPPQTRGPESTRRTLESVLAAIDTLPHRSAPAGLALPDATALEEFVFHHDLVQQWAAALVGRQILNHEMPDMAATFWTQLRQAVINSTPTPDPVPHGPQG